MFGTLDISTASAELHQVRVTLAESLAAREFSKEFRLAEPGRAIQVLLFTLLAPIARLKGLKPR